MNKKDPMGLAPMGASDDIEITDERFRLDSRSLAEHAFSRAAGAPLIQGNCVRLLKDAKANYPAWHNRRSYSAHDRCAPCGVRCYVFFLPEAAGLHPCGYAWMDIPSPRLPRLHTLSQRRKSQISRIGLMHPVGHYPLRQS